MGLHGALPTCEPPFVSGCVIEFKTWAQDQRFQQPKGDAPAFPPGQPLLDGASEHTFHMNIILPRRDVLQLIARCCPLSSRHGAPSAAEPAGVVPAIKPLFTTAAAQLYAESVIAGMRALCLDWLNSSDPDARRACEEAGVRRAEQIADFFSRPVVSTMFHTNLGPDDATVLLPATQDRPVKSLGKVRSACCALRCLWPAGRCVLMAHLFSGLQALLFGAHHTQATLHALSWRLTRRSVAILDDTIPVWRRLEHALLVFIRRAPSARELGGVSAFQHLQMLTDRNNGGDCSLTSNGTVLPDTHSQLDLASSQLACMLEMRRSLRAPDELDILLKMSQFYWSKLVDYEQRVYRDVQRLTQDVERAQAELQDKNKRIFELECQLHPSKRHKTQDSGAAARLAPVTLPEVDRTELVT